MRGENRAAGCATERLHPHLETATLGRRNPWTSRRARAIGTLENSHSSMQHSGGGMCMPEARCNAGGLLRDPDVVWIEDGIDSIVRRLRVIQAFQREEHGCIAWLLLVGRQHGAGRGLMHRTAGKVHCSSYGQVDTAKLQRAGSEAKR